MIQPYYMTYNVKILYLLFTFFLIKLFVSVYYVFFLCVIKEGVLQLLEWLFLYRYLLFPSVFCSTFVYVIKIGRTNS